MSRPRRFNIGDELTVGGIHFRWTKGHKLDCNGKPFGDVCTEWWTAGDWAPVILDSLLVPFAAIAENEDWRYPPPKRGGEYTLQAFKDARIRNWQYAVDKLHRERQAFDEKLADDLWFNQDRDQGGAA